MAAIQPNVYQMKISLKRDRPPIWRRVLVPDYVTLGERYEAEVYAAVSFSAGIETTARPIYDQRSRLLVRMRSAAKPGKNDPCVGERKTSGAVAPRSQLPGRARKSQAYRDERAGAYQ